MSTSRRKELDRQREAAAVLAERYPGTIGVWARWLMRRRVVQRYGLLYRIAERAA